MGKHDDPSDRFRLQSQQPRSTYHGRGEFRRMRRTLRAQASPLASCESDKRSAERKHPRGMAHLELPLLFPDVRLPQNSPLPEGVLVHSPGYLPQNAFPGSPLVSVLPLGLLPVLLAFLALLPVTMLLLLFLLFPLLAIAAPVLLTGGVPNASVGSGSQGGRRGN